MSVYVVGSRQFSDLRTGQKEQTRFYDLLFLQSCHQYSGPSAHITNARRTYAGISLKP